MYGRNDAGEGAKHGSSNDIRGKKDQRRNTYLHQNNGYSSEGKSRSTGGEGVKTNGEGLFIPVEPDKSEKSPNAPGNPETEECAKDQTCQKPNEG